MHKYFIIYLIMQEDNTIEMKDKELLLPTDRLSINNDDKSEKGPQVKEKKNRCQFPSAFTIILIIHTIIFLLIYIIPKGKYDTIEYSKGFFIINIHFIF